MPLFERPLFPGFATISTRPYWGSIAAAPNADATSYVGRRTFDQRLYGKHTRPGTTARQKGEYKFNFINLLENFGRDLNSEIC
jgi:hypothetical protein